MELNELIKEVHQTAVDHGFWEGEYSVPEKLMLIVSEVSEACEADRKSAHADMYGFQWREDFKGDFDDHIKDTFEDELADAAIRIFDLCAKMNIDLEKHIILKDKYNKLRPYKHGKKY